MQKRYVIYSAMVGAYDDILQPKVVDERFDYVLFSNDIKEERVGVWEVRPIAYHNEDRTRICRYVKTHPEELLNEYEVSIWMDSNVQIQTKDFYNRIVKLDAQDVLFSSTCHQTRQCIYQEAFAVLRMRVEHEAMVVDWCHELRKQCYPREIGLFETCILYRKHHMDQVAHVDSLWWKCIDAYSRRDQLSCNYAIWKIGLPIHFILGEREDADNATCVHRIAHKDKKHNNCSLKKNEAWLLHHLWKHPEDMKKIEELYYRLYAYRCPKIWVALAGQYYRIKDRLNK